MIDHYTLTLTWVILCHDLVDVGDTFQIFIAKNWCWQMIKQAGASECRMSKITNYGLTRSGTGCFIVVPIWQQWASRVNYMHVDNLSFVVHDSADQRLFHTIQYDRRV